MECPVCKQKVIFIGNLETTEREENERSVYASIYRCINCKKDYEVKDGVVLDQHDTDE